MKESYHFRAIYFCLQRLKGKILDISETIANVIVHVAGGSGSVYAAASSKISRTADTDLTPGSDNIFLRFIENYRGTPYLPPAQLIPSLAKPSIRTYLSQAVTNNTGQKRSMISLQGPSKAEQSRTKGV